jgi:hypothetical protein
MESPQEKEPSEVITPNTENATFFNPDEASNPERFKQLRFYHRGTWKDRREENKEVRYRQDNLAILDALCGHLCLTDYQKKEARRLFDGLDHRSLGKRTDLIAFSVCILVCNDEVDDYRFYPTSNDNDPLFTSMQEDLGFSNKVVLAGMGVVDERRS